MNKKYKKRSVFVFISTALICFIFMIDITEGAAMSLVAFFSVVYSFYVVSTSILFGSKYTKKMYNKIDEKDKKRGIYYIKDYLLYFGRFSIFSIVSITVFALMDIKSISFLNLDAHIIRLIVDPILFGISAVNIYYMTLMLKLITNAMVEESRLNKD